MAHILQDRFSPIIDTRLRVSLTSESFFNEKYEGSPKAGIVKIPTRGEVTVSDYSTTSGLALDTGSTAYIDLVIDKDKAVNEIIDGYEASAVPDNLVADRLDSAGYSLARVLDSDGYVQLIGEGTEFNSAQLDDSTAYIETLNASVELDNNDVPDDGNRWYVSTPENHALLLQDDNFIKTSDMSQQMVRKGQVGEVSGFRVFKSRLVNDTAIKADADAINTLTGTDVEFIAGHPQNAHRVKEWKVDPTLENLRNTFIGASAVQGRFVYGHKVSRSETIYVKTYGTA